MMNILLFSFPGQRFPYESSLLDRDFSLLVCNTIDEAQRLVQLNRIEILFYILDGKNVPFSDVKNIELISDIPCIVFGEVDHPDIRLHYLKEGSDYYLQLLGSEDEFLTCMDHLQNSLLRIERLAYRDALTGAYNRRYFEVVSRIEMERARTNKSPLSLALLDIDRFKQVNDTYGHSFGDNVLEGLVSFLERSKRTEDYVIRLGGEEFVVIMPGVDCVAGGIIMTKILHEIRMEPIAQHDNNPFFVTFSAGVSEWRNGTSLSDWLKKSDLRLYEAKKKGRNRIEDGSGEQNYGELKHASILIHTQTDEGKKKYRSLFAESVKSLYIADTFTDTLRQLEQQSFDVVIIEDYFGKSDFELVKKIRQSLNTPIIMIYPQKSPDIISLLNAGVDDFIVRPYLDEDIFGKVKLTVSNIKERS